MQCSKNKGGFTLVEMSIVIVIIALIAGGAMLGRELLHAAQIRATARQIGELNAAVNTFDNKYGCLPGDCRNASAHGFTAAISDVNGNGDGRIYYGEEFENASHHLGEAGLIEVTFVNGRDQILMELDTTDAAGYPGAWNIHYLFGGGSNSVAKSGHYYVGVGAVAATPDYPATFLPVDAMEIDNKLDDGMPRSGDVRATGDNDVPDMASGEGPEFIAGTHAGPAGANSDFCVTDDSPNLYNIANTKQIDGVLCTVTIKAEF